MHQRSCGPAAACSLHHCFRKQCEPLVSKESQPGVALQLCAQTSADATRILPPREEEDALG
eukprot:741884-Prymnesium_polylepis.1